MNAFIFCAPTFWLLKPTFICSDGSTCDEDDRACDDPGAVI